MAVSPPLQPIEVIRAGTHVPMSGKPVTITLQMLQQAAASYDPSKHEAPVVIGHPMTDHPAYGWVERLAVEGESLFATLRNVDPEFAALVRAGRYKKVSGSFWMESAKGNPTPGMFSLRHVGFLGAAPPAVKGMRDPEFTGCLDGDILVFADQAALDLQAGIERAMSRFAASQLVDTLIASAQVHGRHKDGLLAFMENLNNTEVLAFSEGGEERRTGALAWFTGWLKQLPPMVPLGRLDLAEQSKPTVAAVNVPAGYTVDHSAMDLHARITARAREKGLSYEEALSSLKE